jgi:hypothetical protein
MSPTVIGFSLNGINYSNSSTVLRTDIGEGADALLCTTDFYYCCTYYFTGQFYFPNNTRVPAQRNIGRSGYYKSDLYLKIRLNRQSENGVLTGQFTCEIPTGYYTTSVLYINIGIRTTSIPSIQFYCYIKPWMFIFSGHVGDCHAFWY